MENENPTQTGKSMVTIKKVTPANVDPGISVEFRLDIEKRCYMAKFQSNQPMEAAWISSDVPLEYVPSEPAGYEITKTDAKAEVMLGNRFSCTLRLKPNCKSSEFRFRPVEGLGGMMEIFISAVTGNARCAQRETFRISPLSSYYRIEEMDSTRTFNTLQISGPMTALRIKSWLQICFQDLNKQSGKTSPSDEPFVLQSMLTDSQLVCESRDTGLFFKCENPSTVAILTQTLTKQATQERIKIDIRPTIFVETFSATLKRIDQFLGSAVGKAKIASLESAIAEIRAAEGDDSSLHPSFRSAGWKKVMHGENELDRNGPNPAFFKAMVVDLFKDYARLRGTNIANRLREVIAILEEDYSLARLEEIAGDL